MRSCVSPSSISLSICFSFFRNPDRWRPLPPICCIALHHIILANDAHLHSGRECGLLYIAACADHTTVFAPLTRTGLLLLQGSCTSGRGVWRAVSLHQVLEQLSEVFRCWAGGGGGAGCCLPAVSCWVTSDRRPHPPLPSLPPFLPLQPKYGQDGSATQKLSAVCLASGLPALMRWGCVWVWSVCCHYVVVALNTTQWFSSSIRAAAQFTQLVVSEWSSEWGFLTGPEMGMRWADLKQGPQLIYNLFVWTSFVWFSRDKSAPGEPMSA